MIEISLHLPQALARPRPITDDAAE